MSTEGPDLGLVHRIDQAQAGAFARVSNLVEWISDWMDNQGFTRAEMSDALNDPLAFLAVKKICDERVAAFELSSLLAAAIVRMALDRLGNSEVG